MYVHSSLALPITGRTVVDSDMLCESQPKGPFSAHYEWQILQNEVKMVPEAKNEEKLTTSGLIA